jgi:hypothetical protein
MPLTFVSGDPVLTSAHVLAFGYNAAGRTETSALEMALLNRCPPAFASFGKGCRAGSIKTGTTWLWRETTPALGFMVVRETPVGAARLRYVEAAIMALARDYKLENIRSLALAAPGCAEEWATVKEMITHWLGKSPLPVVVYEEYMPGVKAEENIGN